MTITGAQVKAARKLLLWSQEKLAGESGTSSSSIGKLESGIALPVLATSTIRKALADAGIEFTDEEKTGVRLRQSGREERL
jgi:transcriptional regulator with XRE-family HTH domain